jgi:L-ascorbate oxidase
VTVPLWLPRTKCVVGVLAGVVLLASIVTGPAIAQPRLLVNPPDMLQAPPSKPEVSGAPRNLLRATPGAPATAAPPQGHAGVERFYDLAIRMTPATIYDPTNDRNQAVNLRSYVDATKPRATDAPYVAPLINATPGDTVRITLRNQLDPDPSCTAANTTPDVPHCFNGTNLHSHGLWVSPTGNSDNVLLSINPGVSFQ